MLSAFSVSIFSLSLFLFFFSLECWLRQLAFERNEIPISLGICNTSLYVPFISFSLIEKLPREELKIINANTLGCEKIDDDELTMNRLRFADRKSDYEVVRTMENEPSVERLTRVLR